MALPLLLADGLPEQIAHAHCDGESTTRVLLDLTLEPRLQAVEARVTQPVGTRLHPAGDLVGGALYAAAVGDHRVAAARCRCAGQLTATRALGAQLLGAALEGV